MEETETKLKELIVKRYGSLNKFCDAVKIPWSTMDAILKRGIANSNIANMLRITEELNLDVERLLYGEIKPKSIEAQEPQQGKMRKVDIIAITVDRMRTEGILTKGREQDALKVVTEELADYVLLYGEVVD